MSADAWEIVRSMAAVLALLISVLALVAARRDRSSDSLKAALNRIESALNNRIDAERQLAEERHNGNTTRLGAIDSRLSTLDEAIKHVPTQNDFRSLQQEMGLVATSVAKLEGSLEASMRMVERMNQYLMEKGT